MKLLTYILRYLPAVLFFYYGIYKLLPDYENYIFTQLEMEPVGRYLVGLLELLTAILLLTRHYVTGAILSLFIMTGALIAHISVIGIAVNGDSGWLFSHLVVNVLCAVVLIIRNPDKIPLFGKTFQK